MPLLEAQIRAEESEDVVAGELTITVTFTNTSSEPVRLNVHQASHPALVLDVRDQSDREVLLPPPSAPDERDLEGEMIDPGESVTIDYVGFLDRSLAPGGYRIRYFGEFPALGGSKQDPLRSDWLMVTLRPARGFPRGIEIPDFKPAPDDVGPLRPKPAWLRTLERIWEIVYWDWLWRLICWILTRLLGKRCVDVRSQEIDQPLTETISNAPAGAEAWNGTYGWRARFLLTLDTPNCTAHVLVRVRRHDHGCPAFGVGDRDRSCVECAVQALRAAALLLPRRPAHPDRHPVRDLRRAPGRECRREHYEHGQLGRERRGRRVA